tara:strand:+ start:373 stop:597 length:225 start_codon:yes stop_codon:yes gene_type:complete
MKNFRKFMEEVDPSEEDDDKKSSPELISLRKNKEKSQAEKEKAKNRLDAIRKKRQETAARSMKIDQRRPKEDKK